MDRRKLALAVREVQGIKGRREGEGGSVFDGTEGGVVLSREGEIEKEREGDEEG